MKLRLFLFVLLGLLLPTLVLAAPKKKAASNNRGLKAVAKGDGRRIALVIGNSAYKHPDSMPRLTNPANDADDMAAALRGFGFEVIAKKNLSREEMDSTIADFGRRITNSEAALFYYAGHGLQVKGQNYLVPVDANISTEAQVPHRTVNLNQLLEEMDNSKSRVNIVMLDACRNNPISGSFRSGASRGLAAPASSPKGTVIVYATDPGNVAADGSGRNGLFTAGLLTAFKGDDLSLFGVLSRTSEVVEAGSNRQQSPYVNGPPSVQKNFSFAPGQMSVTEQPQQVAMAPRPQAPPAGPGRGGSFTDPVTGMEFVGVKGGCFDMGDSFGDGEADEKPMHEVCVSDFSMGKYEVTVGQFRKFINATGYRTDAEKNSGGVNGCFAWEVGKDKEWDYRDWANWKKPNRYLETEENHPVACISWNDANEFIRWLNSRSGSRYRLPTEAEWEYAARANSSGRNYWGNSKESACGFANVADQAQIEGGRSWTNKHECSDGYPYAASVGQFKPNNFGLHDMMGNVWEWTADLYDKDYYATSPKNNPQGPSTGQYRVLRGGSWNFGPASVRAAYRNRSNPAVRLTNSGFRLAVPAQ